MSSSLSLVSVFEWQTGRVLTHTQTPTHPITNSRSPFINADGAYLLACANARKNYIKNDDLIGVVKSYFPSTPYSKYQARFVGAPEVRNVCGHMRMCMYVCT